MYTFLIIFTSSIGMFNSSTSTYHSLLLLMLSYARQRSIKTMPSYLLVLTLYWIIVCKIKTYSSVLWLGLKPAYIGACRSSFWAVVVRRLFITAMKSFIKGGAIAMLRQLEGSEGLPLPLKSGTILVLRHDAGALLSIVHVLRKAASCSIPLSPKCFNNYSGRLLNLLLLLALNLYRSMYLSSSG